MNSNLSGFSKLIRTGVLLVAFAVCALLRGPGIASAKEPFTAFTYAAAPVLQNPGQGSQACMDTGVPVCPVGHVCGVFSYSGSAVGSPGFGKTNIEVCILEDKNYGGQNAAGGICYQSAGFAQVTYKINRKGSKVVVLGLIGQTCEVVNGSAIASLVQNMNLTQGAWAGTMSISSLVTDGADAYLSIYGAIQSGL